MRACVCLPLWRQKDENQMGRGKGRLSPGTLGQQAGASWLALKPELDPRSLDTKNTFCPCILRNCRKGPSLPDLGLVQTPFQSSPTVPCRGLARDALALILMCVQGDISCPAQMHSHHVAGRTNSP
jgi:hypothetical protein